MTFRSILFVPGSRSDRFGKAVASGVDAVCIDLEDAVSTSAKNEARVAALNYLSKPHEGAVGLRINGMRTIEGLKDCAALIESQARPVFVLLPKIKSADEIEQVKELLGEGSPPVWALIETPAALFKIDEIAIAVGADGGLMFGGADMSASFGSDMGWDALYFTRAAIIAASAAAGCQTMDVPWLNVLDIDGMAAETRRVKAMGFTGRAAIHPSHVAPINEIFTPSAAEIKSAQEKLAAYDAAGGVLLHEGSLVEKPVLAAARRVLAIRDHLSGKP